MRDNDPLQSPRAAPKRNNARRLVVSIVIIVVIAGVLGWFVTDTLQTATSAMKGR